MDNMQRKLSLKAFLSCSGYKIFREELDLYYENADNRVINKYKKAIGLDGLSDLNFDLGEKTGLGKVLNILESYKLELEDKSQADALTGTEVQES